MVIEKHIPMHEEQEITKLRLDIFEDFILVIYRNFAAHWWWEGLNIKSAIDLDPVFPNRHLLHQTEDSGEYDPILYPTKPYKLGYLELIRVVQGEAKPVDVRLVCAWNTVQGFWKELEQVLRREFPVIEYKQKTKRRKPPKEGSKTWDNWKRVWNHMRSKYEGGMTYTALSEWLGKDPVFKHLPHDRNTLSLIASAGKAGFFENKKV